MGRRLSTRTVSDRMSNAIKQTTVQDTSEDHLFRELTINLFANEKHEDIEHVEPYGFTSRVKKPTSQAEAAEAVTVFPYGSRSQGVTLVTGDRRYRLKGLKEGEAALYDDQGHQVHFTRDGLVISVPNSKKIVTQIMQEDGAPASNSGGKGGQSPQAGRSTVATLTLDKNGYNISHNAKISWTVGQSTLTLLPDKITVTAPTISNKVTSRFETIGETDLGLDSAGEGAPLGETGDVPYKQTYVKLIT